MVELEFESEEANENLTKMLRGIVKKSREVREMFCGSCAAFPCFRNHREEDSAGLCYQEERRCRQECEYFCQDHGSGKSPEFQIKGICQRDRETVNYGARCRFISENS